MPQGAIYQRTRWSASSGAHLSRYLRSTAVASSDGPLQRHGFQRLETAATGRATPRLSRRHRDGIVARCWGHRLLICVQGISGAGRTERRLYLREGSFPGLLEAWAQLGHVMSLSSVIVCTGGGPGRNSLHHW